MGWHWNPTAVSFDCIFLRYERPHIGLQEMAGGIFAANVREGEFALVALFVVQKASSGLDSRLGFFAPVFVGA